MNLQEIINKYEKQLSDLKKKSKVLRAERMGKELSKCDAKKAILKKVLSDLNELKNADHD